MDSTAFGKAHLRLSPFPTQTCPGASWAHDGSFGNNGILRIGPRGDHEMVTRSGPNSMFEDESGVLWLGSDPMNVSRFQQGRFVSVIGPEHPLPRGFVLKLLVEITRDREGGIWLFDLDQGLFRLADGVLTKIANQSEPFFPWDDLYRDRRGRVWVGQYNHVALYDHGKSQIFGTSDGVPSGTVLANSRMAVSARFPSPTDIGAQSVLVMAEDDEGYWSIATNVGVLRIPAGELDRVAARLFGRKHIEPPGY
jgi:hypothetical protein